MAKCDSLLLAAVSCLVFWTCSAQTLTCPNGWILGWNKCYRIFYGENRRAYARAREVCESYGSRLVTISDQYENDLIGEKVDGLAGAGEPYYIGLSQESGANCVSCPDLTWSNGDRASENEGFWADSEPDDTDGGCVFSRKNSEDYIYDRPYAWSYSNCLVKRSFVCERMAAPEGTFHCTTGGYINNNLKCNGNSDCQDGSDELDCSSNCRYYHTLPTGDNAPLGQLQYRDAWTCTWAIETPPGTNAYVQFNNFNTEFQADFVTVYIGNVIETLATRVDRISGNVGTKVYRSYNNMMFIRFTSDSSVSNTGTMNGFTGIYGALSVANSGQMTLTADDIRRSYTLSTFDLASTTTFLGQNDYVIVIQTEDQNQFGPMITVEVESVQLNDEDSIMFFDGGSPTDPLLASYCNDDSKCANYKVMYSTGKQISILVRTEKTVTNNVQFTFRYRQGCHYETSDLWGTIFTPGFPGGINYPNFISCTWTINVAKPVALYFDSTSRLHDGSINNVIRKDYIKMYDNETKILSATQTDLTTSDIAGVVFQPTTGKIRLEMEATLSAKGFLATWSPSCENPNYDDGNTLIAGNLPPVWYYRSTMTISCKTGYEFQQEQTQTTDAPTFMSQITVECGFMGKWKNYLQIPKCLPKYCGAVPNIPNGIIESATSVVYGGTAKYKCNAGSVSSSGSLEITCQADGTWSQRPICIASTCPSGRISLAIANGDGEIKNGDGTSIGTVYEFTCDPGFEFDGEPYVFCQEDGTWTQNRSPSCTRLTCRLPGIENGFYVGAVSAGQFITYGISATVNCDTGYELANNSLSTITCNSDRTVTQLPQCVNRNECDNNFVCEGTCHDTEGSYYCTCGSGYTLSGDRSSCININECQAGTHNCDGTCQDTIGSYTCSCNRPYVLYTADGTSGLNIPTSAGERGDLPTDTYHIDHSCVLVRCSQPQLVIANGTMLTKRENHYYGDTVEYQCDIGYTPRRTVISCDRNGNWVGSPPTCSAATCSETPGLLQTRPTYIQGPYDYGQRLTLQCDVAGRQFEKFRFCTYNKEQDTYEMQGSPYDCGVVACGQPKQAPGSSYGLVSNTLFGATFEFSCATNQRPDGTAGDGSQSTVRCLAEGYWDFGSLQCTGQSCLDPGYPAGGSIIATSFADRSTVSFRCNRNGYALSNDVTLTCQGTSFFTSGQSVPSCVDVEDPVITGCPTVPIILRRYELLQPRLPQLTVTDNTGVKSFTITPRNANSTLYTEGAVTVIYTATDYADNIATCSVSVQLADETPPVIQCPSVIEILLDNDGDIEQYQKLTKNSVSTDPDSIKTYGTIGEPTTITTQDLYNTFTYTVTVTDYADNSASCRGQIFVKPRPCSDLDYPTPLNGGKTCSSFGFNSRQCVLTCDDNYTFLDSKSKTVTCTNGNWDTTRLSACILDVTRPVVTCPSSNQIRDIVQRSDSREVDFTLLAGSVVSSDLNTVNAAVFTPQRHTFTVDDLYRPKLIQVSVTDIAGNTGTCTFQYTAIPPVCSELTLPVPRFGEVQCTRRSTTFNTGWDCTITCQPGKILRNFGVTKSVSCDDNSAWNDADIYPACIDDTRPPVIVCPTSRVELIYTGNENRIIDFSTYSHSETDYSEIESVQFQPSSLQINTGLLNTANIINMIVRDTAGNQASCSFQVLVKADDCSPLALQAPVNGQKSCNKLPNGYSCIITCNTGHSFYGTTNTEITSSCSNGGTFTQYVPDCVDNGDVTNKQYIATLQYEYIPEDNFATVPSSCIDYYKSKVSERSTVNTFDSTLDQMGDRLQRSCDSTFGPLTPGSLSISFFPVSTTGNVVFGSSRVQMEYKYSIVYPPDPTLDTRCTNAFSTQISSLQNSFPLAQNIVGDGICPTLTWNNIALVTDQNEYCVVPYFQSLIDPEVCLRCPAGTQSDGTTCNICSVGFYAEAGSSGCQQCPAGTTTRYPGAVSSGQCVSQCLAGEVSDTGYSPCYYCPIGSYKVSNTQCQSCGSGKTTSGVGSISIDACIDSTSIYDEPCSLGTQDTGNRVCELCSIGTYRSANTQVCVACPNALTSTYFKGSVTSADCFSKCSAGFISATGLAPCLPCQPGNYWVNSTTCLTCPPDFTTLTTGQVQCVSQAAIRLKCPRGTSRDINTGNCVPCSIGTYNQVEEGSCVSCTSIASTYYTGATSDTSCRTKCPPGFYSSTGLSPCTPCGTGLFSASYGSTACSQCSPNNDMITATTTATSNGECIAQCSPGQFSYNGYNQNGACRQCPPHHYQSSSGAIDCIRCQATTTYSTSGGLTSSNQCLDSAVLCNNKCQQGTCVRRDNEAVCECPQGQYYGTTCGTAVNHCASFPCYNGGQCTSTPTTFTCQCAGTGATGTRCETVTKLCVTSQANPTCKNGGHCLNEPNRAVCLCPDGFGGDTCSVRTDICLSQPCDTIGTEECQDVSLGSDLRRYCKCKPGYTGETCADDVDECDSNPCINGGACVNQLNNFQCECPAGYQGRYCETRIDQCQLFNCRQFDTQASCVDVYNVDRPGCICNPGYAYDGNGFTQYQIALGAAPDNIADFNPTLDTTLTACRDRCTGLTTSCNRFAFDTSNNRCFIWSGGFQLNVIANTVFNMYTKEVRYPEDDFYTLKYNINTPTAFTSDSEPLAILNNVYGLDICRGTTPLSARCCPVGSTCLDNSGLPIGTQCTSAGLILTSGTTDYTVQFKCSANRVFQNNVCRQKTDYCNLDTCQNNGNCRSIFGTYICSCAIGYTGRNCQTDIDDCANNPCNNGGTCVDRVGSYVCQCTNAYDGPNCNSPKNFCATETCNGQGNCRNIEGEGFECVCYPGYEGTLCETETNFCDSNPCQHDGTCARRFNGYTCTCVDGWEGMNCQDPIQHCLRTQTGGRCQSDCYNIFNSYYCSCEANSFGDNCEFKPNPCRDYNKCQNTALCSYDTSMSCTCPSRYYGDGCQILRDYCGKVNPCENEATCMVTDTGYQCQCPPGYDGVNCENEVNECASVTCPGNGQCYDAINKYYCRCPIKYTGTNCAKVFDRNYDLYFGLPRGCGFAWIPYAIPVEMANYITVSLWVRYSNDGDTGVYLTQFIGDTLEEATAFTEFNDQGVRVYVQNGLDPYIQLVYDRRARVNDGDWHLVTLQCDLANGVISHYLDTIHHQTVTAANLVMPDYTFRMWVVLGCEFDNTEHKCRDGGRSFHGYLSQVNWYKRELTFEGDPNAPTAEGQQGEIPRNFRLPQHIFDDNIDALILVWNEYIFESCVNRMIPSEAYSASCDDVTRSPACSSYRRTTLPSVTDCPEDIVINTQDRIVTVTWTEPIFNNLGAFGTTVKPSRLPGSTFTWGVYRNTYIGIDGNNNRAYCHFTVYVTAGQCDIPLDPKGGTQSCNNVSDRKGCMLACNNNNVNTYMLDRVHPDLYTCGPSGWWNADKPFRRFRYPSCGLVMSPPNHRIYIRVSYRIGTSACNAAIRNIRERTFEEFIKLKEQFLGDFCRLPDCTDLTVGVECGPLSKRRKRQTWSQSLILLEITMDSVSARTTLDQRQISAEDFLSYFILVEEVLDFGTIPDLVFLKENFVIDSTATCPQGQVVLNDNCVECGPGNYFRYTDSTNTTAICDDCPLGTYQDLSGASSCKPCAGGFTTEMTGEFQSSSCKKSCLTGQYFSSLIQDCAPCEIGYYQDEVGQFRCKGCLAGYTTKDEGSTSSSFCSVSCDSGYELNNNGQCDHCEIGQYRNAAESRTCVPCQTGFITLNIAAKSSAECNIVECSAGNFRDTDNTCKPCPLNTYQPNKWQTSCISCGDSTRWRTVNVGSISQSQCLYYCPSGYEVQDAPLQNPPYICVECDIGFYKDNAVDIQGMCTACSGNRRTESTGSTSASACTIYKCPVGYKPNSLNNGCVVCPEGTYQDVEYSTDCKPCLAGYSTRQNASTSVTQCEQYCPSGQEKIGDICVPCKKGFYRNINDGLFNDCTACNQLYTTANIGSDNVLQCNIRTCPAGTKRNADDTGCVDCDVGTYQPNAYERDCIPCATGTSTRTTKSTSASQCESYCPSGSEKAIAGNCIQCEIGYYKDNVNDGLFSPCNLCPIDKITADRGSISESLCNVGNCSAGQYLKADQTCDLCAKGFYQPNKWQTTCIVCGQDKTTENVGSDELSDCILECQPGYEDINGVCSPCRRGYYKIELAAASCRLCPAGTTTESTGADGPSLCSLPSCMEGTYLDRVTNPNAPQCRTCAYDYYQDEIWQEECKQCINNRVTLQMGSKQATDCVLDCESGLEYDAVAQRCQFCPRGYYRDKNDRLQPNCQLCPLNVITANEGATNVAQCTIANCTTPGYYRDVNTNTCKECPIGKYSSDKWQTACMDCPLGNSTKFTASTSITDCISVCPLGQYVGLNNRCQLCARGTYRSDASSDTCTQCPNNLLTPGLGSDSSSDCSISPCVAGELYVLNDLQCRKCPVGSYQPNPGNFQCIECPFTIKYTPREGAISEDECRSPCAAGEQFDAGIGRCVRCPTGTYQPAALQYSCLQCPDGRKYTAETGSTKIDDCLSYCSPNAPNSCSPNATCSVSTTTTLGYTCSCFSNYESTGATAGRVCIHKCDRGYCKNSGTCQREPTVRCTCSKWYQGDRCDVRVNAEELSDDTLDYVIPVSIAAGGLILFLIILAVCCLCWRRSSPKHAPAQQYSEFNGERMDKQSLHSYNYGPYASRPPSRLMMLAPAQEMYYDNQMYNSKDHAAIYEA